MFVRLHLIEPAAAPAARLFAIRHSQGHLVRDGDGAVVIGTDVVELDKRRRALNVATVAHIVALVPESDVQHGEAASLVPDALVSPLAAFLEAGALALGKSRAPTLESMQRVAEAVAARLAGQQAEQTSTCIGDACPKCGGAGLTHAMSSAGDVFHCPKCKAMSAPEAVGRLLQPPCWPPSSVLERIRIVDAMAVLGFAWKRNNGEEPTRRTTEEEALIEALATSKPEDWSRRVDGGLEEPVAQEEPLPDAPTDAELDLAAQVEAPTRLAQPEGVADQAGPRIAIEVAEGETATLSVPKKKRKS